MARRKTKKHTTKKRRVGAGKMGDAAPTVIGTIIGVVAARLTKSKLGAKLDPKILAAIQAVGGGVLAWKAKSPLLKGIGYGFAAGGAVAGLEAMNVLTGIGGIGRPIVFQSSNEGRNIVNGFYDVPKVGSGVNTAFPKPNTVGSGINTHKKMMSIYGGIYG